MLPSIPVHSIEGIVFNRSVYTRWLAIANDRCEFTINILNDDMPNALSCNLLR